ncbi:MAG: hypothetical protein Q9213_001867 [Squamulea squamosa]
MPRSSGDDTKSLTYLFLDKRAWKELPFIYYLLANFFIFLGYYIPWFYIPTAAQKLLQMSETASFYLIAVTHTGGMFGRIIPGYIASHSRRLGAAGTHTIFGLSSTIIAFVWMGVNNVPGLVIWCFIWGFFASSHIAMPPAVTSDLCPLPEMLGTRLGMVEAIASPAVLIGSPIAGALVEMGGQVTRAGILAAQAFAGVALLMGSLFILPVWFYTKRT